MKFRVSNPLKDQERVPEVIEYPFGYFDAQAQFAQKWSAFTQEPLDKVLLYRTALYRRVTDEKPGKALRPIWEDFLKEVERNGLEEAVKSLYKEYSKLPLAQYKPPEYPENDGKHFTYFAFDYYPNNPMNDGKNTIKVHFINRHRGSRGTLSAELRAERQKDLARMFTFIRQKHPEAVEVVGGSWLYAIPEYAASFPPSFIARAKKLVLPELAQQFPEARPNLVLSGDSVWGQFMDRFGGTRTKIYDEFIVNLQRARSVGDLMDAFPNQTVQPNAPIQEFYDFFGIHM